MIFCARWLLLAVLPVIPQPAGGMNANPPSGGTPSQGMTCIFVIALVIAAVATIVRTIRFPPTVHSGAVWSASQSWVSSLTFIGTVTTVLVSLKSPTDLSHLRREDYTALSVVLGVILTMAPGVFVFLNPFSFKKVDIAKTIATLFTLTAAFGELILMIVLLHDFSGAGVLTPIVAWGAIIAVGGTTAALFSYAVRAKDVSALTSGEWVLL